MSDASDMRARAYDLVETVAKLHTRTSDPPEVAAIIAASNYPERSVRRDLSALAALGFLVELDVPSRGGRPPYAYMVGPRSRRWAMMMVETCMEPLG